VRTHFCNCSTLYNLQSGNKRLSLIGELVCLVHSVVYRSVNTPFFESIHRRVHWSMFLYSPGRSVSQRPLPLTDAPSDGRLWFCLSISVYILRAFVFDPQKKAEAKWRAGALFWGLFPPRVNFSPQPRRRHPRTSSVAAGPRHNWRQSQRGLQTQERIHLDSAWRMVSYFSNLISCHVARTALCASLS